MKIAGDHATTWFGTDGKRVISVSSKEWKEAKAILDDYLQGKNAIEKDESFLSTRKNLPSEATLFVMADSARMVRDRAHLADLLARVASGGLQRAFVVGGDGADLREYPDGLSLLRAIHEVGPVPGAIGVPCYPDRHATYPPRHRSTSAAQSTAAR